MYDIAGERTGGGNPDWLASAAAGDRAMPRVVQKLLDAGATIIGKTICDEFFYSVAGINAHYGTPVNLRAPGRMPGGSSSGSAAAAAAGACDFALGSDTGGSVRIPASFCGLYGIRTTHGRVDHRARWTWRRRSTPSAGSRRRRACSATSAPCCSAAADAPADIIDACRARRRLRRSRRGGRRAAARCARGDERRPAEAVRISDCAGRSRSLARSGAHHPGARDLAGLRPLSSSARSPKFGPGVAERMRSPPPSPRKRRRKRASSTERAREHIRADRATGHRAGAADLVRRSRRS